jgi:hypothetical protein
MRRRKLLCATALLALAACRGRPADFGHENQGASSRGLFRSSAGQYSMMPCGTNETWSWGKAYPNDPDWHGVAPLFDDSCDEEEDPYCGLVYMEVDGTVSESGSHGYEGRYQREMVVSQVHYASVRVPTDCRPARR